MTIDLHLHTNHSDGNWSPAELVGHAEKIGLSIISITDHDTVSGVVDGVRAAASTQIALTVVPGVEISCSLADRDIHMLGYFIDCDNIPLAGILARNVRERERHTRELLGRLRKTGINIDMSDVLSISGGGSIGKAHVTKAIVACGGADDITDAYDRFLSRQSGHHRPREWVDAGAAIEAIHESGGMASLAHPGIDDPEGELIGDLACLGLDAVEVYHPGHSSEQIEYFEKCAARHGLLLTGGSDCHGPYEEHRPSTGSVLLPQAVWDRLESRFRR